MATPPQPRTELDRLASLCHAGEIGRLVRAARPFILRDLRVRTQRMSLRDAACGIHPLLELHRHDGTGRHAIFYPAFQHGFDVALRGSLARSALSEEIRA